MPTAHLRSKRTSRLQKSKRPPRTLSSEPTHISLSVFSSVLSANPRDVVLEWTMDGEGLDANTITFDFAFLLETDEVRHNVTGETVLSGGEHNLTASELEASSVEGLLGMLDKLGLGPNGDKDLVDVDTGGLDVGLAEGLTHTLLESISTSA
jgi:hypothetical protein